MNLKEKEKELTTILNKAGIVRKDQVSEVIIEDIRKMINDDISKLFVRFIHIYDFNNLKLKEIKDYIGIKEYDTLSNLLRLPGVRLLRAKLYYNSGVNLEVFIEKSTEDIRRMANDYIQCENREEIIPQPKEVNCHREVAKNSTYR